ncbi:MAG: 1-acyl-sn-glycerol-3-phosphate acyltransferase [Desulfobacteraceae bacterium]|nr:1-acyl-sn-glycerol-3-phosphate acyltransferase [Desulfobacteraceae bacterium]MCF8094282.1 1-acyl-sn-glycerol-3-phosphate acyltransferase [Desulfobacteraceae bacterium]
MEDQIKRSLDLQEALGRFAVLFTAPLIFLVIRLVGYRVRNLVRIRRRVNELMRRHKGPWLICANHLTLIDSFILAYVMFPAYRYMIHFRLVPWNMPEYMNFNRNRVVGGFCYLTKCIPVVRGGDRDVVNLSLEKCVRLLYKGENLMIFPEGTRSRTGRINTSDYTYNVGKWFCNIENVRVMCIYLRGDHQTTYGDFPKFGEKFTVMVEQCRPYTNLRGLRAYRACAGQIIEHLADMEKRYFASRWQ